MLQASFANEFLHFNYLAIEEVIVRWVTSQRKPTVEGNMLVLGGCGGDEHREDTGPWVLIKAMERWFL